MQAKNDYKEIINYIKYELLEPAIAEKYANLIKNQPKIPTIYFDILTLNNTNPINSPKSTNPLISPFVRAIKKINVIKP